MTDIRETKGSTRPSSRVQRTSKSFGLIVAALALALAGFVFQPAGESAAKMHYDEVTVSGHDSYNWWCKAWWCP